MKKLLLAALLFLSGIFTVRAQGNRNAILKVLENQRIAWNRGDIEGFMRGYWKSDSLMFVGKTAPVYGWQNTLERYKKAYPGKAGMGTLSFDIIKVDVLDSQNAFVFGAWRLQLQNSNPGGYFTLWFRKIKGEWKVVVDHTS